MKESKPNPGSRDAWKLGCKCSVLDNNHGSFPPIPPGTKWGGISGGWCINLDCPVHGQKVE